MTEIETVRNGFVVTSEGTRSVYKTLDEVFEHLLLTLGGLSPTFLGDGYGTVRIIRGEDTE